jgi:hypothetical protein
MKRLFKVTAMALTALVVTTGSFAQEWTKAQQEVWQVVEDSWTKWKAGDLQGSYAGIHEKYQGWSNESALPMDKSMVVKWYESMKDIMKVDYYMLNPARIVVTDNVAVVDYYFDFAATYTWGDKKDHKEGHGKNAEFYIKEGGKWMLLGDMTIHKEAGKSRDVD